MALEQVPRLVWAKTSMDFYCQRMSWCFICSTGNRRNRLAVEWVSGAGYVQKILKLQQEGRYVQAPVMSRRTSFELRPIDLLDVSG